MNNQIMGPSQPKKSPGSQSLFNLSNILNNPIILFGAVALVFHFINQNKKTNASSLTKLQIGDREFSEGDIGNEQSSSLLNSILGFKVGDRELAILNSVKPYLPIKHQALADIFIKGNEILSATTNATANTAIHKQDAKSLPKLSFQVSGLLNVVKPYMGVLEQAYMEIGVKLLEVVDIFQEKLKDDKVGQLSVSQKELNDKDLIKILEHSKQYVHDHGVNYVNAAKNILEIKQILGDINNIQASSYTMGSKNLLEPSRLAEIAKAVRPHLSDQHKEWVDRGLQIWMITNAAEIQKNIHKQSDKVNKDTQSHHSNLNNEIKIVPNIDTRVIKPPMIEKGVAELEAAAANNKESNKDTHPPSTDQNPVNKEGMENFINAMKHMLSPEERQRLDQIQGFINSQNNFNNQNKN